MIKPELNTPLDFDWHTTPQLLNDILLECAKRKIPFELTTCLNGITDDFPQFWIPSYEHPILDVVALPNMENETIRPYLIEAGLWDKDRELYDVAPITSATALKELYEQLLGEAE